VQTPDGEPLTSVIHDLSVTGALLLVRTSLDVGERVMLQLHISENVAEVRIASGKVVRVVPLEENEIGLWARKVAVQFDVALTIYENEIAELHERQARLGLK
jgi:hypothetical protein